MTDYTSSTSSFPQPMPSISTPIQPSSTDIRAETNRRPRRHTIITRPDSATALLSDMEDDEQEQQETFDRISGILSSLIQEANEAVHGIEQERVQLLQQKKTPTSRRSSKTPRVFTSSTIITTNHQDNSKIPRPRKLRASNTPSVHYHHHHHHRNVSSSSSASTSSTNTSSALFSPISTSTSATLSRSPSPTLKKPLFHRHHNNVLRPRSCPVVIAPQSSSSSSSSSIRRSMTPKQPHRRNSSLATIPDPIAESFKRLDTSMALVDSLSRDLATPTNNNNKSSNSSNNFTFLLLVPLLHIPHSLITMIFDFCTSSNTNHHGNVQLIRTGSFSITSMVFWVCVFTVTNLMVDQVAIIPKKYLTTITKAKTRRMSLPGTYTTTTTTTATTATNKKVPPKIVVPIKRTWIPATIQQQYQFRLGEELPQPQKRRNSI